MKRAVKPAVKPWAQTVVQAVSFGLFLPGLLYVGYVNELLKGAITSPHRGVLIIGSSWEFMPRRHTSEWLSPSD